MDSVSCPICGLSFPPSKIQNHAEACLDSSNKQQGDRNPKKPKLDLTTWGSLAPTVFGKSPSANSKKGMRNVSPKVSSTQKNSDERNEEELNSTKSSNNHSLVKNSPVRGNSTESKRKNLFAPLAEQMRPCDFENFVGQEQIMGQNAVLKKLLETRNIPSIILWGPPGCGKTTLAHIIASESKKEKDTRFVTLSATTAGVSDVKDVVQLAKNEQIMFKRKTILFIDEIHRFNKKQQDTFLPHVENGTIVLIGATTENPSFSLNSALLSRCRVIVLEKLTTEHIEQILTKGLLHLNVTTVTGKEDIDEISDKQQTDRPAAFIEKDAVSLLANLSDGDARIALNSLQLAFQSKPPGTDKPSLITVEHVKDGLQKSHILYDRQGDEHYNCISALHKSMRGSDDTASLYWLARMLQGGEDPLYVARRMVRFASEDIGMADPMALTQAVAAYQGCHFIGMPECDVILAQCAVYLSRAPKSIEVYGAYQKAKQCVDSHEGPLPGVPIHLRNAPTRLMKDLGYGKDYKYNPMYKTPVEQDYLPECLKGTNFFT